MEQSFKDEDLQPGRTDPEKDVADAAKKLIEEQREILSKTPLGNIILQAMEKAVTDEEV